MVHTTLCVVLQCFYDCLFDGEAGVASHRRTQDKDGISLHGQLSERDGFDSLKSKAFSRTDAVPSCDRQCGAPLYQRPPISIPP